MTSKIWSLWLVSSLTPFPLPAPRQELLALVEAELERCAGIVAELGESAA